jgi:signal transduction histidine kinase
MLTVVVLAIALASAGSAYFGGRMARQAQEENLRRVVATLTEAPFPPSESVLRLMSGLSGAEFVLLDQHGAVQASTLVLTPDALRQLQTIRGDEPSHGLGGQPATLVAGRSYLGQRVTVDAREPVVRAGSLIVLYPEDLWSAVMRQAAYPALIAGAVAALAIVVVATVLAHRLVRPIRQLGDQAAAIARGDFRPMAFSRHDDEIRDLAVSINRMSEQLGHYEVQVRRHEQLRTLDRLGAGMAHQLRNAATGGRMAIELHQRECSAGAGSESLEVALRQLQLMESYLRRFMVQGRVQPLVAADLNLATVLEDALSLVRPACAHVGIDLEFRPPDRPLWVRGDTEALRQLVVNLTLNAVEAVGKQVSCRPQITVALESIGPDRAAIRVFDTGPGPAAEVAESLFEPFVSGKPEGTGLGLYVARQVAEGHHGSIRWHRENNTTCFTVELPLLPSADSKQDIAAQSVVALTPNP